VRSKLVDRFAFERSDLNPALKLANASGVFIQIQTEFSYDLTALTVEGNDLQTHLG
jgi:hypothetical protein